jgi:hypothetical protein
MVYLYQDESGDMGFDFAKSGTSKHFSIALLILNEQRPILSLVNKIFRSLPRETKRKNNGMLHAYYEKPITVSRLLRSLAEKEIKIASIRLDKRKMFLSETPHNLYANIVVTLINRLHNDGIISGTEDTVLIASRMNTSKHLNLYFSETVINRIQGAKFNILIVKPNEDKCLQAADFVSWALWQKYERGVDTFYNLVSNKIVREYVMYE